jgi:NitT/TauT family transport system permease protein
MAGELLVIIPGVQAIGTRMSFAREFSDAEGLIATMIVILMIGLLVDAVFGSLERSVLRRRGLAHAR